MTKKLQSELKGLVSYRFGPVVDMLIIGKVFYNDVFWYLSVRTPLCEVKIPAILQNYF